MTDMTKSVKIKDKPVCVPGEVMYLRLLAINATKNVSLECVMSFENSAVPLSIFCDDGTMITGKKSVFMQKLESLIPSDIQTTLSGSDCIIIDGNAVIQILAAPKTGDILYRDMAQ